MMDYDVIIQKDLRNQNILLIKSDFLKILNNINDREIIKAFFSVRDSNQIYFLCEAFSFCYINYEF